VVAADQDVHLAGVPGEEHGGLARGVAGTDDYCFRPPAERHLIEGRGVVDTAALEPLAPFGDEPAVVGPVVISKHLAVTVSPPSMCKTLYALSNLRLVTGV